MTGPTNPSVPSIALRARSAEIRRSLALLREHRAVMAERFAGTLQSLQAAAPERSTPSAYSKAIRSSGTR